MKKILPLLLFLFTNLLVAQVGINTTSPNAQLDIASASSGLLIPRVALASTALQSPVSNPNGGNVATSTLVYNTATAGTATDAVTPGFYYWNGTKWIRFDVGGEQMPKYYFAKGTTNAPAAPDLTPMPEMSITLIPEGNTVIVNFSAGGYAVSCQERTVFFQILLNGIIASQWQTSTEQGSGAAPIWDTSNTVSVAVVPDVPQTISVSWFTLNCTGVINQVATPLSSTHKYRAHRELIVIDPAGGAANIPSVTPVTTTNWNINGNTGINATQHFIGTTNAADVIFKRNDVRAGRLGIQNTAFGNLAMSTATGVFNTAIGDMAIQSLTGGGSNTAVGSEALADNTGGSNNTAVGRLALAGNVGGTFNTAVGTNSLLIGGGSKNTAVGALATMQSALSNATAIGANAFVTANDALVLGSINGENNATTDTNVGIGTTAPLRALHISRGASGATPTGAAQLLLEDDASIYQQFLTPATNESGLLFGTSAGSIRGGLIFDSSEKILFRTGGNITRMTLTPGGNLGIGTVAPVTDLEISGTGESIARVSSTSATGSIASLDLFRNGAGSGDWRLRNAGGELYFMRSDDDFTTAPDEHYRMTLTTMRPLDNTKTLGLAGARWISIFATNGTIQTSDFNDKRSIRPIESGLEKVMKLKPVSFEWKDRKIDNYSEHLGFIAQEVQKVLPAVVVDSDWAEMHEGQPPVWRKSERLGMKYAEITPVLVKAIQEQQTLIEEQNIKLTALSEANRSLQQKLENQEEKLQEILNRLPPGGR